MVDWGSSGLGVAFGARTGAGRRRALYLKCGASLSLFSYFGKNIDLVGPA